MNRAVVTRLTALLFFSQSIGSAGFLASTTVGALVGEQLTGRTELAGVPSATYLLGNALGAYPAARYMERVGRRIGITTGFVLSLVGTLIALGAILAHSFIGFLIGFALMGFSRGFTDLARYAAADMYPPAERGRAISNVVLGGTIGAILGPALTGPMGRWAVGVGLDRLAGPWFASFGLFAIGVILIFFFLRPDPSEIAKTLSPSPLTPLPTGAGNALPPLGEGTGMRARSWFEILRDPRAAAALSAMVLGQVVMVMIMAITSIHMTHNGHILDDVSLVLTAHTLGMFAPAVFSGWLADKIGRAPVILIGGVTLIVACLLAPLSQLTWALAVALFLLGLGWNFCYVAGAALLTDALSLSERAQMQGSTDGLVGFVSALGSFGSGFVFAALGYALMAYVSLVVTLIPMAFALNAWRTPKIVTPPLTTSQ